MSLEEVIRIAIISLIVCYIIITGRDIFKSLLEILNSFDSKKESFIAWIVIFILILIIEKVLIAIFGI